MFDTCFCMPLVGLVFSELTLYLSLRGTTSKDKYCGCRVDMEKGLLLKISP